MHAGPFTRIMILGGPGSGKSWLARELHRISGLPVWHMDHIHWLPGWVERDGMEKDLLTRRVHARPEWIFEGGHSRTYKERAARADLLIWLDMRVALRVRRVLARSWRHSGEVRPDMAPDCREVWGRQTTEFLRFMWRTRKTARLAVQRCIDTAPAGLTVAHLSRPARVEAFLTSCAPAEGGNGLILTRQVPFLRAVGNRPDVPLRN